MTRVEELRRVERYDDHIAIGAAVTLTEPLTALVAERPQLKTFANRFAGLPVRNSGTLGGNVANGSPIGDSMPLLIALGAHVVLLSARGHRDAAAGAVLHRLPQERAGAGRGGGLDQGAAAGAGRVPARLQDLQALRRRHLRRLPGGEHDVRGRRGGQVGIGAGGVAATPVRAVQAEAALRGQPWTPEAAQQAAAALRAEFQPISDMRASAAYRAEVLGNLMQRFWLESQGMQQINLESFRLRGSRGAMNAPEKFLATPGGRARPPAARTSTKAPAPRWPAAPPTSTTSPR